MQLLSSPVFKKLKTPIIALIILAAGIVTLMYMVNTRAQPEKRSEKEPGRLVRVFKAQRIQHQITINAFGVSRAGEEWSAIAEVKGRVVEIHPKFEAGQVLPKDALILRIDPTEYRIALKRYQADVRSRQHQLKEINQKEENLKRTLALQKRQLKLVRAEYERIQSIFKKGDTSQSNLDQAEANLTKQQVAVQEIENQLNLIPVQRDLQQANLELANAQIQQASFDLSKTEIRLPFKARCMAKSIELDQYAAMGQTLGKFIALDTAEVVASVEARKIRQLWPGGKGAGGPVNLDQPGEILMPWDKEEMKADVSWGVDDTRFTWSGRISRIGASLDAKTRTAQVIVEVPDPYKNAVPGLKPPLFPDVFCRVTFYGAVLNDVFVLPKETLRSGRIYLIRKNKLHIQTVDPYIQQDDLIIIKEGLQQDDRVVLTDLFPAIEGMPLRGEIVPNPALQDDSISENETAMN